MRHPLPLVAYLALTAFTRASLGYLALHAAAPQGHVFGSLFRMYLYHEAHPFQYIALITTTYALIATACIHRWPHLAGWRRAFAIVGIIGATILVASAPGGALWKIHDMQAGHFTTGARFWRDLLWGASTGLELGWLILALSAPYNIIGLILGYALTHLGFKLAAPTT